MFVGNSFRQPRTSNTQSIDPSYFPQFQIVLFGGWNDIQIVRGGNKCLLIAAFKDRNLFPGYWEDNQRPPGYCILRLVVFIGTAC
ncbi:hypothetical protein Csa_020677 [Cucumis sativus]|uniref:Uncharacterized protein n=1 Tax=Cucumis sativus TaxID=3659 RepID=A0A0A0KEJ1_CUCSA|nr:hypothetical protein Csa_020677 [Cucumis sativus]